MLSSDISIMIFSLVLEPCGSRVMVTLGQVGDAGASTTAVSTECVLMWPASKGVGKPTYRVGSWMLMESY